MMEDGSCEMPALSEGLQTSSGNTGGAMASNPGVEGIESLESCTQGFVLNLTRLVFLK